MSRNSTPSSDSSRPMTAGVNIVSTHAASSTLNLSLPILVLPPEQKGKRKTVNQKVVEILQKAAQREKRGEDFFSRPTRLKKGVRLAALYNSNLTDKRIKGSVLRNGGDELRRPAPTYLPKGLPPVNDGFAPSSSFTSSLTLNESLAIPNGGRVPYSQRDFRTAKEKIKVAAEGYSSASSKGMKAFDDKNITPISLQDLLFRNFLVKLTLPEATSVVDHFDKDKGGTLDYAEFLTSFFKIVNQCKEDRALDQLFVSEQSRSKQKHAEAIESEKFAKSNVVFLPSEFSAADLKSALDKIGLKASWYDRNRGPAMRDFASTQMDPTGFKQQLVRMFDIRMPLPELAAAFMYFDRDGSGLIDMTEFLISFFQLAPRGVAKRLDDENARKRARKARRAGGDGGDGGEGEGEGEGEREALKVKHKANRAAALAMSRIRDMAKSSKSFNLRHAFDRFDVDGSGSINHEELTSVVKSLCGDQITGDEIQCVINLFDPNGDGDIRYDEFAYSFYNRRSVTDDDIDLNEERVLKVIEGWKLDREATGNYGDEHGTLTPKTLHSSKKPHAAPPMTAEIIKAATHIMDAVRQCTLKVSLREAFDSFDTDGSGIIDHEELVNAISEVSGKRLSSTESQAIIAMFDPNGDGGVAYDEFCWTFYNRRDSIRKMEWLMKMQQAEKRVNKKLMQAWMEKQRAREEGAREYLPDVHINAYDAPAARTAKIASTLIGNLQKNKERIRNSALKQSASCTLVRSAAPSGAPGQTESVNPLLIGKEFKSRVLKYELKVSCLSDLASVLYRRTMRTPAFIDLLAKVSKKGGEISRIDFGRTLAEQLGDVNNSSSHNRLFSCFDPNRTDRVFIGELAVGLEFIASPVGGEAKSMVDIFPLLCEWGRDGPPPSESPVTLDLPAADLASNLAAMSPTARSRSTLVPSSPFKLGSEPQRLRLGFEKVVKSFMTLAGDDGEEAAIAAAFRGAYEKSGFGSLPSLGVRRDLPITWGGRWQALTKEEFKRVVMSDSALVECIKKVHKGVFFRLTGKDFEEEFSSPRRKKAA